MNALLTFLHLLLPLEMQGQGEVIWSYQKLWSNYFLSNNYKEFWKLKFWADATISETMKGKVLPDFNITMFNMTALYYILYQ